MNDIIFFIAVFAGLLIIFGLARRFSRKKAKPNSYLIDRSGKYWLYIRKVKNGHLFINPAGKMETLTNTNIFKGYKFR